MIKRYSSHVYSNEELGTLSPEMYVLKNAAPSKSLLSGIILGRDLGETANSVGPPGPRMGDLWRWSGRLVYQVLTPCCAIRSI